jgi:hypothetical protein
MSQVCHRLKWQMFMLASHSAGELEPGLLGRVNLLLLQI